MLIKQHLLSIPGKICSSYSSDHPTLLKSSLLQKSFPCYLEKQDNLPNAYLPISSAPIMYTYPSP